MSELIEKHDKPPIKRASSVEVIEQIIKVFERFSSKDTQKTEVPYKLREVLSSMKGLSKNPFPTSNIIFKGIKAGKVKTFEDIYKITDENRNIEFLEDFIKEWTEIGLALDRKGRTEDKEVLKSMLSAFREDDNTNDNQTKKLPR